MPAIYFVLALISPVGLEFALGAPDCRVAKSVLASRVAWTGDCYVLPSFANVGMTLDPVTKSARALMSRFGLGWLLPVHEGRLAEMAPSALYKGD